MINNVPREEYLSLLADRLLEYRENNGKQFKRKLRELFFGSGRNGINSCPYLQTFRNRFYDCLDKITGHTTKEELIEILDKGDEVK